METAPTAVLLRAIVFDDTAQRVGGAVWGHEADDAALTEVGAQARRVRRPMRGVDDDRERFA